MLFRSGGVTATIHNENRAMVWWGRHQDGARIVPASNVVPVGIRTGDWRTSHLSRCRCRHTTWISGHDATAAENRHGADRHQMLIHPMSGFRRMGAIQPGSNGIIVEPCAHRANSITVTPRIRRTGHWFADEQSSSCATSTGVDHRSNSPTPVADAG